MSHTTDLPTSAPPDFIPGETLEWTKSFDNFPADEWTVTYYFRGAGTGFDAIGTADDLDHVFTVPSSTSDDASPGSYYFQAFAVKGAEKFLVDEGEIQALPNIGVLAVGTSFDGRSPARKILDAIDALMQGKATIDQQEYMIGAAGSQRMLKRIGPVELLELRKYYAGLVRGENTRGKAMRDRFIQFD